MIKREARNSVLWAAKDGLHYLFRYLQSLPIQISIYLAFGKPYSFGSMSGPFTSMRLAWGGIPQGALTDSLNTCFFRACQVPDIGLSAHSTAMKQCTKSHRALSLQEETCKSMTTIATSVVTWNHSAGPCGELRKDPSLEASLWKLPRRCLSKDRAKNSIGIDPVKCVCWCVSAWCVCVFLCVWW